MMEPQDMIRIWKNILDDLRSKRVLADLNYMTAVRGTQYQLEMAEALTRAQRAYDSALDACLAGEDPVIWKLSYSG